jgi:hypothetical protein
MTQEDEDNHQRMMADLVLEEAIEMYNESFDFRRGRTDDDI